MINHDRPPTSTMIDHDQPKYQNMFSWNWKISCLLSSTQPCLKLPNSNIFLIFVNTKKILSIWLVGSSLKQSKTWHLEQSTWESQVK